MKSGAEVTPDGRIRIHSKSVKCLGVPMKPLMKLFSVEMDDLVKVQPGRGVTVDGNDLILDPARLLPPPAMSGKITAVRIAGNALVETFGSGAPRAMSPPPIAKNYMYWRGGQLEFGKLTMTDADLELVDDDPGDPFDFSIRSLERTARRQLLENHEAARVEGAPVGLRRSPEEANHREALK